MQLLKLQTNGNIKPIECPEDPDASWLAEQIGCEWIEIVHPKGFDFILIVDEEGLLNEKPFNYYGSYIYGTQIHGQPIVGNVLIADENADGSIVGLPIPEATGWRVRLQQNFDMMKRMFGANA